MYSFLRLCHNKSNPNVIVALIKFHQQIHPQRRKKFFCILMKLKQRLWENFLHCLMARGILLGNLFVHARNLFSLTPFDNPPTNFYVMSRSRFCAINFDSFFNSLFPLCFLSSFPWLNCSPLDFYAYSTFQSWIDFSLHPLLMMRKRRRILIRSPMLKKDFVSILLSKTAQQLKIAVKNGVRAMIGDFIDLTREKSLKMGKVFCWSSFYPRDFNFIQTKTFSINFPLTCNEIKENFIKIKFSIVR